MLDELKRIHVGWWVGAVMLIIFSIVTVAIGDPLWLAGFQFGVGAVCLATGWCTRNDRMRW